MMNEKHVHDSVSDYLDGTGTVPEGHDLPLVVLQEQLLMHDLLGQMYAEHREADAFVRSVAVRIEAEQDSGSFLLELAERLETQRRPISWLWYCVAVAACILCVLSFMPSSAPRWQGEGFVAGRAVYDQTLANGTHLVVQETERGRLTCRDGSQLLVTGPAECIIAEDGYACSLLRGQVRAVVVPQPAGRTFSVQTADMTVEVLGTEFTVISSDTGSAVAVTHGHVQVEAGAMRYDVHTGEAAAVQEGQVQLLGTADLASAQAAAMQQRYIADFESGIPEGWRAVEMLQEGLPTGSRGAVRSTLKGKHSSRLYHEWFSGFPISQDNYLLCTYRLQTLPDAYWGEPSVEVNMSLRGEDAQKLQVRCRLPIDRLDEWRTVAIPLRDLPAQIMGSEKMLPVWPDQACVYLGIWADQFIIDIDEIRLVSE